MIHLGMVGIAGKEEPAAFPCFVILAVLKLLKGLHYGIGDHRFHGSVGAKRSAQGPGPAYSLGHVNRARYRMKGELRNLLAGAAAWQSIGMRL